MSRNGRISPTRVTRGPRSIQRAESIPNARRNRHLKSRAVRKGGDRPKGAGRASAQGAATFPELLGECQRFGLGLAVSLITRQGGDAVWQSARFVRANRMPGERPTSWLLERAEPGAVAKLLTGLAHIDRIRIVRAIATGSATHRDLSEAVGLKTGPLYHHLRALERAGVVCMSGRNAYELTDAGRIAAFLAVASATAGDRRHWRRARIPILPAGRVPDAWRMRPGRKGRMAARKANMRASES